MIEPEREVEAVTDVHVVLLLMLSSNGSSAEQHWKMRHAVAATIAVMIFFFIVIVVCGYCDAKIARNGANPFNEGPVIFSERREKARFSARLLAVFEKIR
jgi:NADH:ubiquinone oxidoreductase subunit 6 (subunit J)